MIFYPGSFKPPHRGHFNNLKYLLKKFKNESILIIISKKERVKLVISFFNSPILTINSLLKQKNYNKVYLVKSSKNSENKRFNSFNNKKIKIIIIPELKNIDSKDFREKLYKNKNITNYLPNGINKKNI